MITTTLDNIVQSMSALGQIAQEKISAKTAIIINGVINKCESELKPFNKVRDAKLQELGEKKSDGTYFIPPENTEAWNAIMLDAVSTEVKINTDVLDAALFDDIKISAQAQRNTKWLINWTFPEL